MLGVKLAKGFSGSPPAPPRTGTGSTRSCTAGTPPRTGSRPCTTRPSNRRTKLQLERATEEQAQTLEDFKLNAQMNRAARRRTEQGIEVETEIELGRKRQEAELRQKEAERTAAREQRRRDAEAEQEIRRQAEERTRQHLAALKEMSVDLTAYLTQGRADRVIELRGRGGNTHVHLDNVDGNGEPG